MLKTGGRHFEVGYWNQQSSYKRDFNRFLAVGQPG